MDKQKRTLLIGLLFGLWMVGLIVAGIAYRMMYQKWERENPPPVAPVAEEVQPKPSAELAPQVSQTPVVYRYDEEETVLEPGLQALFQDDRSSKHLWSPAPALNLAEGESTHPTIAPDRFAAHWVGVIKILRAGQYQFSAVLSGRVKIQIGETVVFDEDNTSEPKVVQAKPVELEAGYFRFEAEYHRTAKPARLQAFWESPYFSREPLNPNSLGHVQDVSADPWKSDSVVERGRLLAEEHSCVACHQADSATELSRRTGPDLTSVAARAYPDWIARWLENPRGFRPQAVMPQLFDASPEGEKERQAVAAYLGSLAKPLAKEPSKTPPDQWKKSVAAGEKLFGSVGCAACHFAPKGQAPRIAIGPIAAKTNAEELARFLSNPFAHHAASRMPDLALKADEARDLARYLVQTHDDNVTASTSKPAASGDQGPQLIEQGRSLVEKKQCAACHTIAPQGKALALTPAKSSWKDLPSTTSGCLSEKDSPTAKDHPRFGFSSEDRSALIAFLKTRPSHERNWPAPGHRTVVDFDRLHCRACHDRDHRGGLTEQVVELVKKQTKAKGDELTLPPSLTGVGSKLRTSWIGKVMLERGRSRPWMSLRMPQFGKENVGRFVEQLAKLDGAEPSDAVHVIPFESRDVEDGRYLVSRRAFGCLSCHDIAGIAQGGKATRGPDLAETQDHLRYEWFRRWMLNPQRIAPSTKMPSNFTNNRSAVFTIHDGDAYKQIDALWSYFSLGKNLPLPAGNEPPEAEILTVADHPRLVRTFLPEVGAKGIAIGYPGDVSMAFDADRCRLAYAWSGSFIDIGPAWNNRGGVPSKPLGNRFWTGSTGFPWAFSAATAEAPDFDALAKDPAYHAPLPEGQLPAAPYRLQFDGYSFSKRQPSLKMTWTDSKDRPIRLALAPGALRSPAGVGVRQQWQVDGLAGESLTGWLWVGDSSRALARLTAAGALEPLSESSESPLPAAENRLALWTADQKVHIVAAETDGVWIIQKVGKQWRAILRIPVAAKTLVTLDDWTPFREEPAILKTLAQQIESKK